jgi:hypothetical protein
VTGISRSDFLLNWEIFTKVVVSSMTGIDTTKVIVKITNVVEIPPAARRMDEMVPKPQRLRSVGGPFPIDSSTPRLLALMSGSLSIDYSVNFILQDLEYITAPSAYSNMTSNLAHSISMGNFTAALKTEAIKASLAKNQSIGILFQNVTVGVSPFEPDKFVILVFNSTILPTSQPSSVPTLLTSKSFI